MPGVSTDCHANSPERSVIPDGALVPADGTSQRLAQRKTLLRQLDAGQEQLLPRKLAVSSVRQFVTSDLTGHSDRQTTWQPGRTQQNKTRNKFNSVEGPLAAHTKLLKRLRVKRLVSN